MTLRHFLNLGDAGASAIAAILGEAMERKQRRASLTKGAPDADAPLIRSSIGCLEGLLLAQDAAAWEMSAAVVGPRRAVGGLLSFSLDPRPKVRKRAQEALRKIPPQDTPTPR